MEPTIRAEELRAEFAHVIAPGTFEARRHYYPRVLNAQIHPLVAFFLRLSRERLLSRYCHLNPQVNRSRLEELLRYNPKYFRWAGADLFHTTTAQGHRRMVVIETNSCPSGNKSMPLVAEDDELGGYKKLLSHAFLPYLSKRGPSEGALAVLFDKNMIEASGYAAALAELAQEPVYLVPFPSVQAECAARFVDGTLEVKCGSGNWVPIRAALRYVTQTPWNRIPVRCKTRILNPVIACLAGGRNKLVASKAYDLFNAELAGSGLHIHVPDTVPDLTKEEIPLFLRKFGGRAVIKIPYSNAGQGVFPIINEHELEAFMERENAYERYILQSLIGNYHWSSAATTGQYFHVGTMPDRLGNIFVADVRMMIAGSPNGFVPVAIYARKAKKPLPQHLEDAESSWEVLGTNLSEKRQDGGWNAETERLLIMDRKDFNTLGLGLDDLIEGYIQAVLATIAIDRMAAALLTSKGELRLSLFRSLDDDPILLQEISYASARIRAPQNSGC